MRVGELGIQSEETLRGASKQRQLGGTVGPVKEFVCTSTAGEILVNFNSGRCISNV